MFVNGDAIGLTIMLLMAGVVLLCLALTSHVVWIGRLVRSRTLDRFGIAARIALLALAAATPVISFYCASILRYRRRHALHLNPAPAGRTMLALVCACAVVVLVILAIEQVPGQHGSDGLSRLPGVIVVLAVPCAVLGMACQVLGRSRHVRIGLIVVAGSTAIWLFLLG